MAEVDEVHVKEDESGAEKPTASKSLDAILKVLASLEIGPMSDSVALQALQKLPAREAAQLVEMASVGTGRSSSCSHALTALCRALYFEGKDALSTAKRQEIVQVARDLGFTHAASVLGIPESERTSDFIPPFDPEISALSVGHQKSLARRADPERIARLAAQGDVRVVQELLLNPRLTEALLVRIAAKRPIKGEVLACICKSPKWGVRFEVKRAVAMNPYAPASVVLPLIPTLTASDLKTLANSEAVNASVRSAAQTFLRASTRSGRQDANSALTSISSADASSDGEGSSFSDGDSARSEFLANDP